MLIVISAMAEFHHEFEKREARRQMDDNVWIFRSIGQVAVSVPTIRRNRL